MEASIGAQLRRLATPVPFTVRGKAWRLKVVAVLFSADFEAHGAFGFESESANAHSLCRLCDFSKQSGQQAYRVRTDFLNVPGKRRVPQRGKQWSERTAAAVEWQMAQLALDTTGT